jgi:hypothetical protein
MAPLRTSGSIVGSEAAAEPTGAGLPPGPQPGLVRQAWACLLKAIHLSLHLPSVSQPLTYTPTLTQSSFVYE